MYPPQTSLLPVVVTLAKFVEIHIESYGWLAICSLGEGWFPYWYLGVPFRYLTGPLVPTLQVFLHTIFPSWSLFEVTYVLLALSFIASIFGWAWLVIKIQKVRFKLFSFSIGHLAFIILLILPWRYLSSLALSEPSFVIARNILPFVLITAWDCLESRDKKSLIIASVSTAVLLLINTSILAILVVGLAAIALAASFRKGKIKKPEKYIKPLLIILGLAFLIATSWYDSGYWITLLTNPSIGGAAGFKVILRIFDLLKAAVPLVIAVSAVYFSGKIKSRLTVFSLTWTLTFVFLTIFRFIGDPDFWQDWTAWVYELEIGVALLVAKVIDDLRLVSVSSFKIDDKRHRATYYILPATLLLPFLLTYHVYCLLDKPPLITRTIPQGVQSLEKLDEIVNEDEAGLSSDTEVMEDLSFRSLARRRVFLSGSTVFWAGSTGIPLSQVRGGADKAAVHPFWDHAAYQLREGSSPELAKGWLEALGVEYVLLHGPFSSEAYHDFRNLDKWSEVGEVVWEGRGDVILKIDDVSPAWVVDLASLEQTAPPESGTDFVALNQYLAAKKRPIDIIWEGPNKVTLNPGRLENGEAVVMAITYDRGWSVQSGYSLQKDALGNILVLPADSSSGQIILEY